LTAYPDVQARYKRVAFQKKDARRFQPDEVDFIAFGHPLLESIVMECKKRDEGFGGAASVLSMNEDRIPGNGVLFNYILRYTDASGEVLSEDFPPIFVTEQGDVEPGFGQVLIDRLLESDNVKSLDAHSWSGIQDKIKSMHEIAFIVAQTKSQDHGEKVSEKRERDIQIQIEDLERWRQASSQIHHQRLREYRKRLAEGEDMKVSIRREERLLQDVEEDYSRRKASLESQRMVVSQAPELLNLAICINN
jgi:hypothetical protein